MFGKFADPETAAAPAELMFVIWAKVEIPGESPRKPMLLKATDNRDDTTLYIPVPVEGSAGGTKELV